MKKTLLILIVLLTFAGKADAQVLFPNRGGTGLGNSDVTAGDVGNCLKVLDDSPFTFELGDCGSGGGGGVVDGLASTTPWTAGQLVEVVNDFTVTGTSSPTVTKITATNASSTNLSVSGYFDFLGTIITDVSTWFNGLFDTQLATKDTDDLTEGSNLYYTDARVNTLINASSTILTTPDIDTETEFESLLFSVFTPNDGALDDDDLSDNSTTDLSEGTNLYYTDARVNTLINASSTIWNNNTEASLESFLTDVTNVFTNNDGALADDDLSDNNLADLSDVGAMGASSTALLTDGTNASWQTILFSYVGGLLNLGTQVTGTLLETNGGTGQSTYTTGDILYSDASNSLAKLGIGSTGQVLKVSGGVPVWGTDNTGGGGGSGLFATTTSTSSYDLSYLIDTTSALILGSDTSTSTAKISFDPNIPSITLGTEGALNDSTTQYGSSTDYWKTGKDATDNSFAITRNNDLGTSNAITINTSGVVSFGTDLADSEISDTLTIGSGGTVDWTALSNYPTGCTNQFVRSIGDTLTCATVANTDLANSSVSYGGVSVSLGGSDATPAFNLADATGLPISTGVSGLGTGVATFLGTPSSANFFSAITDETGSGSVVGSASPTFTGTVNTAALTASGEIGANGGISSTGNLNLNTDSSFISLFHSDVETYRFVSTGLHPRSEIDLGLSTREWDNVYANTYHSQENDYGIRLGLDSQSRYHYLGSAAWSESSYSGFNTYYSGANNINDVANWRYGVNSSYAGLWQFRGDSGTLAYRVTPEGGASAAGTAPASWIEALMILADGKVGIGDTTPASLFTVGNGDLFQIDSNGAVQAQGGIPDFVKLDVESGRYLHLASPALLDNSGDEPVAKFSDTTDESVEWQFTMPNTYSSNMTLKAKVKFKMTSATSGNAVCEIKIKAVADGETTSTETFDTVNSDTETVPGTAGQNDTCDITLTNNDSVNAGESVFVNYTRNGGTASGDQEVIDVIIYWD